MAIISLVSLIISGYLVFRILVRRDYQRFGKLSRLVSFLELLVWLLFVAYPSFYNPPDWWLVWGASTPTNLAQKTAGSLLVVVGMGLAILAMTRLGLGTTMGRKASGMQTSGLYHYSRNPQLVGGALMVLGVVLLWPSLYALGWLLTYGLLGHWMVLAEEEHLLRAYGKDYAQYRQQIPRYLPPASALWNR